MAVRSKKGRNMKRVAGVDLVLLLLLFGIYFVLSYSTSKNIAELIYGIILIFYHIKLKFIMKKYN